MNKFHMFATGFCASTLMWMLFTVPKDMPPVVVGIMVALITFLGVVNFMMGLNK